MSLGDTINCGYQQIYEVTEIHRSLYHKWASWCPISNNISCLIRGWPFKSYFSDFEKKFPASACQKKKIACSTNVTESLWEKKGKKYPAHQTARKKKFLMTRNHPPPPSRVKWSAPKCSPRAFKFVIRHPSLINTSCLIYVPYDDYSKWSKIIQLSQFLAWTKRVCPLHVVQCQFQIKDRLTMMAQWAWMIVKFLNLSFTRPHKFIH